MNVECAVPECFLEASYMVAYDELLSLYPDTGEFFAVCKAHSYYQRKDDALRPLQVPLAAYGR